MFNSLNLFDLKIEQIVCGTESTHTLWATWNQFNEFIMIKGSFKCFSPWKLAITENTFGASHQPYRTSFDLSEMNDEFDSFARAYKHTRPASIDYLAPNKTIWLTNSKHNNYTEQLRCLSSVQCCADFRFISFHLCLSKTFSAQLNHCHNFEALKGYSRFDFIYIFN